MTLTELLNGVSAIQVTGHVRDDKVTGIEYDSRKVKSDSVFAAIKGFNVDGHKFINDALNSGAIAIILDNEGTVPDELYKHSAAAKILVNDSRSALAEASDFYFGHPSTKLNLIGITGTNGKTTTSYFIKNILESADYKTGLLGTISNFIGAKKNDSKLTTPEANDLNEMLRQMVNEGCEYAVMEVSSHSLALKRVHNLYYSSAIFTNITAEHLDFHHDFESYLKAKKILFDGLDINALVVYNYDDDNNGEVLKECKAKKYSYGTLSGSDFLIKQIEYDLNGTSFIINYEATDYKITTSLVGEFNAYNATAAFAITKLHGVKADQIINGIKTTPQVPGRFEVISKENKKVVIDYAHSADSLEKVLKIVNKLNRDGVKTITVFGCGGNRDKLKRPQMGKIASEFSDEVIITSDNPRNEDPYKIIDDIKSGIKKNNFNVIENRQEAIKHAINNNDDSSIILIAGKGHEDYQEIKGVRTHFSDREVVENYMHT
ncbi:MAG: UDP-N-acetylmuramoyl-L-alanyl-D-glutamate--2,6-diaminopimelate ligase [Ignavibacteriaceae bacterium]|jgi:UDP-N-acetylmuramoyl-L-alanyl-D-glutamate--2,6-diaminopimelate ligase